MLLQQTKAREISEQVIQSLSILIYNIKKPDRLLYILSHKTLNEFIAAPMKKVPGTRMPIGVADPAKRAALIAWLRGKSDAPKPLP